MHMHDEVDAGNKTTRDACTVDMASSWFMRRHELARRPRRLMRESQLVQALRVYHMADAVL